MIEAMWQLFSFNILGDRTVRAATVNMTYNPPEGAAQAKVPEETKAPQQGATDLAQLARDLR